MTRCRLLALAAVLLAGCADANAPPPEPVELLLVVNQGSKSLTIVDVDAGVPPTSVALGGARSEPTDVAAREEIAVVPLGPQDEVAVVDLLERELLDRVPLPPGSGATGAAVLNDSIAWVGNPLLGSMSRVNYRSGIATEVRVGGSPQGFALTRGRLFVLNGNLGPDGEPLGPGWVTVHNPASGTRAPGVDSIALTGPGNTAFAALAGDGLLYIMNRGRSTAAEGRLSVVDPLERTEVSSFAGFGRQPGELAISDRRLFVSSLAEGLLEFDMDRNDLVRGQQDGVNIPTNSGVAVDSKQRIYAIEAGGCVAGQPGVAHVLDQELQEAASINLQRCSAGTLVVRIGVQPGDSL
jgi:hypothetical protein